jgi:hypothetical protein
VQHGACTISIGPAEVAPVLCRYRAARPRRADQGTKCVTQIPKTGKLCRVVVARSEFSILTFAKGFGVWKGRLFKLQGAAHVRPLARRRVRQHILSGGQQFIDDVDQRLV